MLTSGTVPGDAVSNLSRKWHFWETLFKVSLYKSNFHPTCNKLTTFAEIIYSFASILFAGCELHLFRSYLLRLQSVLLCLRHPNGLCSLFLLWESFTPLTQNNVCVWKMWEPGLRPFGRSYEALKATAPPLQHVGIVSLYLIMTWCVVLSQ